MKDHYLFQGERTWFILAIWFMAILSLLTMCSEGLRSWGDQASAKQMWAELGYQPSKATYVHFFDNDEGTNNDQFFYTNVSSSGRMTEFVDVRRYCYRWHVHHLSKDHSEVLRKVTDRGNIRFGLEKGFAYLFLDRYPQTSDTCKAMAATRDKPAAAKLKEKQPGGTGIPRPPTTVRIGPFGPKSKPTAKKRIETPRRPPRTYERPPRRTLGHGTTLRQGFGSSGFRQGQ